MGFMETKFCTTCDEDYDWAAPECPGCVRRRYDEAQAKAFADLKAERDELRAEVERLRAVVETAKAFSHATRHLDGDESWNAEAALHAAVDALAATETP